MELDPESLAEAGGESIIHPAGYDTSIDASQYASRSVDELGGERSMRRRSRRGRADDAMERSAGEIEKDADDDAEEGSTMDIEED